MIGTLYTTEGNFKSTLILNNKGPNQIVVTPILHGQNGQTYNAPPVAVGGQSSYEVDLNAIAAGAGPQFRSGSFEFTYTGRLLEMGGGLRIIDSEKSLIFDEQMLEPGMKFSSSQLEAVYAIPFESAQVSVIITNTTPQPILVKGAAIFTGDKNQRPIQGQLKPYETQVVNLSQGQTKEAFAGAVSLTHNGGAGALLAMIHIHDSDNGYSQTVNFNDPSHGKTNQLHGAGLRLGSINNDALNPVIAVRNLGADATIVSALVPYSKQDGSTGKISLPQLSLAPGEIKLLDASNPQLRRNDFATAGLEIEYKGAPGSVIASAASVSRSGNHVFTLPLKDPKGGLSSTGGYPWFINETSSTVVFIKNVTSEQQRFHLDLVYPGGRWGSNLRTLAPGQTFALDVRAIRDSQEKGAGGNTIPLDVTVGHVSWSAYKNSNKPLIGRAQTLDFTKGIASTYECQCPCNATYSNARLVPSSVTGIADDTQQFLPQQQDTDCMGNPTEWYDVPFGVSYSSDDTSVATINASGLGTALAPGTTNIRASWTALLISYEGDPLRCESFETTADCSSFCDVLAPSLDGPMSVTRGGSATFNVRNARASQVSNWRFSDGTNTVNGPNSTLTWSGTMVTSGTISVTVTQGGQTTTLTKEITVNARTNFAFTAVGVTEVQNGFNTGDVVMTLPNTPEQAGDMTGLFNLRLRYSASTSTVNSGPNQNYKYVTSMSQTFQNLSAACFYLIAADVKNTSSAFYQAQCGNYNAQTNPNGYISGANLLADTIRHEAGAMNSHYSNYVTAQNMSANNIGVAGEPLTAPPSTTLETFGSTVVADALSAKATAITNATGVEPCGVQYIVQGGMCVLQGRINFPPYVTCP